MCTVYRIRVETSEGQPHPAFPETVELSSFVASDGDVTCLCGIDGDDEDGRLAREAFLQAVRPFLQKVAWDNIIIVVR